MKSLNYFTKKLIVRDPRTETGLSRTGPGPAKNLKPRTGLKPVTVFKSRTEPNKKIFSNLGPIQTDWSQGLTFRGSLFIEMSEEVILVKSEDDENVPKSPVYLSETTSESSKPEAVSVIK